MSSPSWQMTQPVGSPGGFKTQQEYDNAWKGLADLNKRMYGEGSHNRTLNQGQNQFGTQAQPQGPSAPPSTGGMNMSAWAAPKPQTQNFGAFAPPAYNVTNQQSQRGNLGNSQQGRPPGFQANYYDLQGNPTSFEQQQAQRGAMVEQMRRSELPYNFANAFNQNLGQPQYNFNSMLETANKAVDNGYYNPFQRQFQAPNQNAIQDLFTRNNIQAPPGFMDQLLGVLGQQAPQSQFGSAGPTPMPWASLPPGYDPAPSVGPPQRTGGPFPSQAPPPRRVGNGWLVEGDMMMDDKQYQDWSQRRRGGPGQARPVPEQPQGTSYGSPGQQLAPPPSQFALWRGRDSSRTLPEQRNTTPFRYDDLNRTYASVRDAIGDPDKADLSQKWWNKKTTARAEDPSDSDMMGDRFLPIPRNWQQKGSKAAFAERDPDSAKRTELIEWNKRIPHQYVDKHEPRSMRVSPAEKEGAFLDSLVDITRVFDGPYTDRLRSHSQPGAGAHDYNRGYADMSALLKDGLANGKSYDDIYRDAMRYVTSDHVWRSVEDRISRAGPNDASMFRDFTGFGLPSAQSVPSMDWERERATQPGADQARFNEQRRGSAQRAGGAQGAAQPSLNREAASVGMARPTPTPSIGSPYNTGSGRDTAPPVDSRSQQAAGRRDGVTAGYMEDGRALQRQYQQGQISEGQWVLEQAKMAKAAGLPFQRSFNGYTITESPSGQLSVSAGGGISHAPQSWRRTGGKWR